MLLLHLVMVYFWLICSLIVLRLLSGVLGALFTVTGRGRLHVCRGRGVGLARVMLLYLVRDDLAQVSLVYALLGLRHNLNVLCVVPFDHGASIVI